MANKLVLEMLDVTQGRETIWVNHPLTHNDISMQYFIRRGVRVFDNDFDQVPPGALTVFSAHGITPWHMEMAQEKDLLVFDATCPLVKSQQDETVRIAEAGGTIVLLGAHASRSQEDHPETASIKAFAEQVRPGSVQVIYEEADVYDIPDIPAHDVRILTQTTLGKHDTAARIQALQEARPDIVVASRTRDAARGNLCYATTNRQEAIEHLIDVEKVDSLLVVGSVGSHNSKMLARIGEQAGVPSYLINTGADIQREWFSDGMQRVGVSGGASAEESLIQHALRWFGLRDVPIVEQPPIRKEKDGATFPYPEITQASLRVLQERYQNGTV